MNWLIADSTLEESAAGAPTLTVTGPDVVVTPVSVSVTPGMAPATELDADEPGTPSIEYVAFWPCLAWAACSDRTPSAPVMAMKPGPVSPVLRLDSTSVPASVAAAYTVADWSLLIASARS